MAEALERRVKRVRLGKALDTARGVMVGKPGRMTADEVLELTSELRSNDRDGGSKVTSLVRTNITIREDVLQGIDEIAGPRGRSAYIADAAERQWRRDRLGKVLKETRGAMVGKPGRRTADEILRDLRELRQADRDR